MIIATIGTLAGFGIRELVRAGIPHVQKLIADPSGYFSRTGDVLVWNSAQGQETIAVLQGVADTQKRIEKTVNNTAEISLNNSQAISSLTAISFAGIGVTALFGGAILWRVEALNKKLDTLSQQIKDIDGKISAQQKAQLKTAVEQLIEYERSIDVGQAKHSKGEEAESRAHEAYNIYGGLLCDELKRKEKRINVINYNGRCYILGLMTRIRALLLLNSYDEIESMYDLAKETLREYSKVMFDLVIGEGPEIFLSSSMKTEGVTLEVMTEIYQNAYRIGVTDYDFREPSDLFEHCRVKGIAGKSFMPDIMPKNMFSSKKGSEQVHSLKFLMSTLEEVSKIESSVLIVQQLKKSGVNYANFEKDITDACSHMELDQGVAAFSFS